MDMQENIWIALAFSFFFSGMEVAYLSANKLRYELDKNSRSLTSWILDLFFRNPNQFIATMLVGNAIAFPCGPSFVFMRRERTVSAAFVRQKTARKQAE